MQLHFGPLYIRNGRTAKPCLYSWLHSSDKSPSGKPAFYQGNKVFANIARCGASRLLLLVFICIYPVVAVVCAGKVESWLKTFPEAGLRYCLVLEKSSRKFAKAGRPAENPDFGHAFSFLFTSQTHSYVEHPAVKVESAAKYRQNAAAGGTCISHEAAFLRTKFAERYASPLTLLSLLPRNPKRTRA